MQRTPQTTSGATTTNTKTKRPTTTTTKPKTRLTYLKIQAIWSMISLMAPTKRAQGIPKQTTFWTMLSTTNLASWST